MKSHFHLKSGLFLVSVLLICLLSGCSIFESDQSSPADKLAFQLMLDSSEVAAGDVFTATYTATNMSRRYLDIGTGCVSFAEIGVYKNEQRRDFFGANTGCRPALGSYQIGPGETLTLEWEIHAFTLSREIGQADFDTTFAAPGTYTLRVYSHISSIDDEYISIAPKSVGFNVR